MPLLLLVETLALSDPPSVVVVVAELLPVREFNDAVSPETDNPPPPPPSVDIDKTDNSAVEAPSVDSLPDSRTDEIDEIGREHV